MNFKILMIAGILVAGCAELTKDADVPAANPELSATRPVARPESEILAEAAEVAPNGVARRGTLGVTVGALDAKLPGLMVKTPLVQVVQQGQIRFGSKVATVQLIPITGPSTGGSFISLAAMQAVGAPLAGLPELTVIGL